MAREYAMPELGEGPVHWINTRSGMRGAIEGRGSLSLQRTVTAKFLSQSSPALPSRTSVPNSTLFT